MPVSVENSKLQTIRFSIRKKLLLAFLGVIILFGSLQTGFIFQIVHNALSDDFEKKGTMLAKHLGTQLEEYVLYEDIEQIQYMLWSWKSDANEHGYAMVISSSGEVIASTFGNGVPSGLVEANLPVSFALQTKRIIDVDVAYLDFAVPLLDGAAGWVRLGIHEEPLTDPEQRLIRLLLGMVLIFVLLGIIGAYIISKMVSAPILNIVDWSKSINLESDTIELNVNTKDELQLLAESFEDMTLRLQENHRQLSEINSKSFESQKLAALGLLASGITHEINNPLAGLDLSLKRISRDPENVEQIQKYLPGMYDSISHMQNIVRQTLAFAKPEPQIKTMVGLQKLLDHSLVLVQHKLDHNNIIVIRTGIERSQIMTNPQSISQVFVNLMLNAIDSMPMGGNLSIESTENKEWIHISFRDTGSGINPEIMDRIWEPFYSTKPTGEGTGLGLSVSRRLVEKLSGKIEITSTKEKGTTVTLSFPSEQGEQ
jgi:two-component system, NtrC family, sensor kinase